MIISNDLRKAIGYKIGKFNSRDVSEEDIGRIEEIDLSGVKLNGDRTDIDLKELEHLQSLKLITLKNFELDDEAVRVLNSLSQLETMYLAYCNIDSKQPLINGMVQNLVINDCRVSDYSTINCARNTTLVNLSKLKIDRLASKDIVEVLRLVGCDLQNSNGLIDYSSLTKLLLEGTKISDRKILEMLENKVEVTELENQYPIR